MSRLSTFEISRRSLLRGAAALAALVPATASLAACSSEEAPAPADEGVAGSAAAGSAPAEDVAAPEQDAAQPAGGSVLVTYFSATGNTEAAAQAIAEHLGADVFEIMPAEPYTDADLDYNDSASRTSVERAEDARPELAQLTPDGFDACDTVFVGYPIWWGDAAWPVKTFAENNDFTGKTVVPFCTSASSGVGGSGDELAELAGTGDWLEGRRFAAGSGDDAAAWADSLGL